MSDTQLISCPACGATNRVPREKIDQKLVPGRDAGALEAQHLLLLGQAKIGAVVRAIGDQALHDVLGGPCAQGERRLVSAFERERHTARSLDRTREP